jgi:cell division septation protein DedD
MRILISAIISLLFLSTVCLQAQTEKVRVYLKMVALGQIDDVKSKLPDLLAEYPADPGVQLLHAVVIEDAFKAVEKYKTIVKVYPDSEWADDAYWRIVQFYAVIGDTARAKNELNYYRKKYPSSEFLIAASDVVRQAVKHAQRTERGGFPNRAVPAYNKPVETNTATKEYVHPQDVVSSAEDVDHSEELANIPHEKPVEVATHDEPIDGDTKYGLQVGIYRTYEAAKAERDKFSKLRMLSVVKEKKIDGENFYAVVIGNYSSRESAETAKHIVQNQCKCNPIIYQK